MNTNQHDADQTALAARLNRTWLSFKQGKLIGYRFMALILIIVAAIGSTGYILHERHKTNSLQWMQLAEANTQSALEELSKTNPNSIQERLARFQIARDQLGINGIDQLAAPDRRQKAVDNIVKSREEFGKLAVEFNEQPVLKAECLLGMAKAEAALVAVPTTEGQLTEFKGTLPNVVEYLDQFVAATIPGTPWNNDAKKLADQLRDANSSTAHEFVQVARTLYSNPIGNPSSGNFPSLSGMPPELGQLFPGKPPTIPGLPNEPAFPKVEPIRPPQPGTTPPAALGGVIPPSAIQTPSTPGKASEPPGPIAPPAKGPDTKAPAPGATPPQKTPEIPAPIAPPPKK